MSLAAHARGVLGPGADVARFLRPVVVARDDAEVFAGVDDVRIARVGVDVAGLAAADVVPVGEMDAAGEAVARSLRGAEILHRAGDVVRTPVVDRHVVELRDRQRRRVPVRAAVARDVDAAVVGDDHPLADRRDRSRCRGCRRARCPSRTRWSCRRRSSAASGPAGTRPRSGFVGVHGQRRVVPGALAERRGWRSTSSQLSPPSSDRKSPPFSASISA